MKGALDMEDDIAGQEWSTTEYDRLPSHQAVIS